MTETRRYPAEAIKKRRQQTKQLAKIRRARDRRWGARRIMAELLKRGWTKWAIKKRLHVHYNTVANWEKGIHPPTAARLEELRALLTCEPATSPAAAAMLETEVK